MTFLAAAFTYANIGLFTAIVSRLTGANASMLIFCCLLYLGIPPLETLAIMLTYLVFTRLTIHTQEHRLSYKTLHIFHGWRIIPPMAAVLLSLFLYPLLAIAIFLGMMFIEMLSGIYRDSPAEKRLTGKQLTVYITIGSILSIAGAAAVTVIPAEPYMLSGGIAIIALCCFFRWADNSRSRLNTVWDKIIIGFFLFTGLFGFDLSDWLKDAKRSHVSLLSENLSLITVPVFFITFAVLDLMFGIFSISGFILTVFGAIAIRIFGYYKVSERGRFSLIALVVTVLAVLCLFLVNPQPSNIEQVINGSLH